MSHNWSSTSSVTGRMVEICTGYGNSGEDINLSLSNFAYMKPTISVKGTSSGQGLQRNKAKHINSHFL